MRMRRRMRTRSGRKVADAAPPVVAMKPSSFVRKAGERLKAAKLGAAWSEPK